MEYLMYGSGEAIPFAEPPSIGVEPILSMAKLIKEGIRFGVYSGYLASLATGSYLNNAHQGHIKKLEHKNLTDIDLWVHYDDFDDAVEIMSAEVRSVKHESLTVDNYQLRFQLDRATFVAGHYEIEFCRQRTPIFAKQGKNMLEYPWKVGDSMATNFSIHETEWGPLVLSHPYDSLLFYLILGRSKDEEKIRLLIRANAFSTDGPDYFQIRHRELGINENDRVLVRLAEVMMSEYRALAKAALANEENFCSLVGKMTENAA